MHKKPGSLLFECLIVIALISGLSVLSFQFLTSYKIALVHVELEKLYALMLYAQRKAYLEHKDQVLKIDVKTNKYTLGNSTEQLSPGVIFGLLEHTQGPPYRPEYTVIDPVTFKNHMIFFYADGTISAGTIYITDSKKSCMYALSCAVSQISYLRKYKYQNGWIIHGNFTR